MQKEISIKDLLINILLHWRGFLLSLAVGMILVSAISLVKPAQPNGNIADVEDVEVELSEEEKARVNFVLNYEEQYSDMVSYANNSALMQLDAGNVVKATLIFSVESKDEELNKKVASAYRHLFKSGSLYSYIEEKSEATLSTQELSEIIVLGNALGIIGNDGVSDVEKMLAANPDSVFEVSVYAENEEESKTIVEQIKAFVSEKAESMKKSVGKFDMELLDENVAVIASQELMKAQSQIRDYVLKAPAEIERMKALFSSNEVQYYTQLKNEGLVAVNGEAQESTVVMPRKISIKKMVLGGVLFAFVYAVWCFFSYIFSDRLRRTDNLKKLYHTAFLGSIHRKGKKRAFGFVDAWVRKLQKDKSIAGEEEIRLAALEISSRNKTGETQEVYLVAGKICTEAVEVCEKLIEELAKRNVKAIMLDNILYNIENREKVCAAKKAVVLGIVDYSLCNELQAELDFLHGQQIETMGMILIA